MQNRNLTACAILLTLLAGVVLAADITGNWTGSFTMGDNQLTLTYMFKQDGEKLTGSVTGPQGNPLPLDDGKVQGDKVSFSVTAETPNGAFKILNEGTIKGDEITLKTKMGDFPESPAFTLKRAK